MLVTADFGAQSKDKAEATFMAAQKGNLETLKGLLNKPKSTLIGRDSKERTQLGAAAWSWHLPVVDYLINNFEVSIDNQGDTKKLPSC